jgi:hypothetical protein
VGLSQIFLSRHCPPQPSPSCGPLFPRWLPGVMGCAVLVTHGSPGFVTPPRCPGRRPGGVRRDQLQLEVDARPVRKPKTGAAPVPAGPSHLGR